MVLDVVCRKHDSEFYPCEVVSGAGVGTAVVSDTYVLCVNVDLYIIAKKWWRNDEKKLEKRSNFESVVNKKYGKGEEKKKRKKRKTSED